jgi:hypothetical protein
MKASTIEMNAVNNQNECQSQVGANRDPKDPKPPMLVAPFFVN